MHSANISPALAEAYFNIKLNQKVEESITFLRSHVDDNAEAAFYLGLCYRDGAPSFKVNIEEATKLLFKAADKSKHFKSIFELAILYLKEAALKSEKAKIKILKLAITRFEEFINLDSNKLLDVRNEFGQLRAKSKFELAFLFQANAKDYVSLLSKQEKQQGIPLKTKVLRLLEESAEEGYQNAQYELARILAGGYKHINTFSSVELNLEKAIFYLKQIEAKGGFKYAPKPVAVIIKELESKLARTIRVKESKDGIETVVESKDAREPEQKNPIVPVKAADLPKKRKRKKQVENQLHLAEPVESSELAESKVAATPNAQIDLAQTPVALQDVQAETVSLDVVAESKTALLTPPEVHLVQVRVDQATQTDGNKGSEPTKQKLKEKLRRQRDEIAHLQAKMDSLDVAMKSNHEIHRQEMQDAENERKELEVGHRQELQRAVSETEQRLQLSFHTMFGQLQKELTAERKLALANQNEMHHREIQRLNSANAKLTLSLTEYESEMESLADRVDGLEEGAAKKEAEILHLQQHTLDLIKKLEAAELAKIELEKKNKQRDAELTQLQKQIQMLRSERKEVKRDGLDVYLIPEKIITPVTAKKIIQCLKKAGAIRVFTVGGIVRESIKKTKDATDIDIRFGCDNPKQLFENAFREMKNVKVVEKHKGFEITIDGIKVDLRHSPILSDRSKSDQQALKEDALTCDLTRNALFGDEHGNGFDPTNRGYQDIRNDKIVTIQDPVTSFKEDPIRILKLIKYSSLSGIELPKDIVNAFQHPEVRVALNKRINDNPQEVNSQCVYLFCQGNAVENWWMLHAFNLHTILFPWSKGIENREDICEFLNNELEQMDAAFEKDKKTLNHAYTVLTLTCSHLNDTDADTIKNSTVLFSTNFSYKNSSFENRIQSYFRMWDQPSPSHWGGAAPAPEGYLPKENFFLKQ